MTATPDIFTNVHKGIRNALFAASSALGRAGDDPQRVALARRQLQDALRFVSHHGENEDLLLVPLLRAKAPQVCECMQAAHEQIEAKLAAISSELETAKTDVLYQRVCDLVVLYLDHMRVEEQDLEPVIRAALTKDDLDGFGRASVERTAPADQRMMLAFMLPAMTRADVESFLARLPAEHRDALRDLADLPSDGDRGKKPATPA